MKAALVVFLSWLSGAATFAPRPLIVRKTLTTNQRNGPLIQRTLRHDSSSALWVAPDFGELLQKLPPQNVIRAVDESPGGRIIASDLAASTGISISQARKDLAALASLTQGDLAVSDDGEIVYTFPQNLSGVLSSNSVKYRALQFFEKNRPTLFNILRVGYGVTVLVLTAIVFLALVSKSDDDDGGGIFGGGGDGERNGDMFWGGGRRMSGGMFFDLTDLFFYGSRYSYYDRLNEEDPERLGFLKSLFSYTFGDGDPNKGLDETRLKLVSNMIRKNNGAVTAEQLAPFCDDPPEPILSGDSAYVDERFVLPIVTKLNGEPRVTDEGDIVYVFSDLQVSASSSSRTISPEMSLPNSNKAVLKRAGLSRVASTSDIREELANRGYRVARRAKRQQLIDVLRRTLPSMTKEEMDDLIAETELALENELEFSEAPVQNLFFAFLLGAFNFIGSAYLLAASFPMGLILFGGGVLYNVIPLARWVRINRENKMIEERNRKKREWRTALSKGVGGLSRKIKSASTFGRKLKKIGDEDIVYDTSAKQPWE